jgi:hypothetical protein
MSVVAMMLELVTEKLVTEKSEVAVKTQYVCLNEVSIAWALGEMMMSERVDDVETHVPLDVGKMLEVTC